MNVQIIFVFKPIFIDESCVTSTKWIFLQWSSTSLTQCVCGWAMHLHRRKDTLWNEQKMKCVTKSNQRKAIWHVIAVRHPWEFWRFHCFAQNRVPMGNSWIRFSVFIYKNRLEISRIECHLSIFYNARNVTLERRTPDSFVVEIFSIFS